MRVFENDGTPNMRTSEYLIKNCRPQTVCKFERSRMKSSPHLKKDFKQTNYFSKMIK